MCAIKRSSPKAGVGQILELSLEYFSNYVYIILLWEQWDTLILHHNVIKWT